MKVYVRRPTKVPPAKTRPAISVTARTWFRVEGLGVRVLGIEFMVQGTGLRF